MVISPALRRACGEAASLLLGSCCAGCSLPGAALCTTCRAELASTPRTVHTPAGLPVTALLTFDGVVARCIRAMKEEGRTGLVAPLARPLRPEITREQSAYVVPIPTSAAAFRRRGYRVAELLVRGAGAHPRRLLRVGRAVADQRGLGRSDRVRNVHESMRVRGLLAPGPVVLVDDVITTGATMDEATRALADRGFAVVAAVALAATPIQRRLIGDTSGAGGDIR
ncbi:MAG: ComF family protein [Actinomycetota bacterium]